MKLFVETLETVAIYKIKNYNSIFDVTNLVELNMKKQMNKIDEKRR